MPGRAPEWPRKRALRRLPWIPNEAAKPTARNSRVMVALGQDVLTTRVRERVTGTAAVGGEVVPRGGVIAKEQVCGCPARSSLIG